MKIYRGIPTKYRHLPMVPSALRPNEIKHMEDVVVKEMLRGIKELGIDPVKEEKRTGNNIYHLLDKFKKDFINRRKKGPYADVTDHAVYCFFLSIYCLYITLAQNPAIANQPMFRKNPNVQIFRDEDGKFDPDKILNASWSIPVRMFNWTVEDNMGFGKESVGVTFKEINEKGDLKVFLGKDYKYFNHFLLSEIGDVISLMELWSNLQHLNYNLRESYNYNLFPTMVMDWTCDINVAKSFAKYQEDPGTVVSIDLDMYEYFIYTIFYEAGVIPYTIVSVIKSEKFNSLGFGFKDVNPILIPRKIDGGYIVGCGRYTEERFKEIVNMQNQKGVTIFWPWEYKIAELQKNKLGKELGFEVLQY